MQSLYRTAAWVVGLLCLIVAVLYWTLLTMMVPSAWRFAQGMPIPPWSVPEMTQYGDGQRCGAETCERFTRFATSLPAEQIQAFYRERLRERGWYYRCTASPELPPCFFPYDEPLVALNDVFNRGDRAAIDWDPLVIQIGSPGQHGLRRVQIIEPAPVVWQTPGLGLANQPSLLGDWQGVDPDGRPFLLRFFDSQRVWIVRVPDSYADAFPGIVYQLDQSGHRRMLVERNRIEYSGRSLVCSRLPAFFQRSCHQESDDNYIVFRFDMLQRFNGNRLTLTDPDGHSLVLWRSAGPPNDN